MDFRPSWLDKMIDSAALVTIQMPHLMTTQCRVGDVSNRHGSTTNFKRVKPSIMTR